MGEIGYKAFMKHSYLLIIFISTGFLFSLTVHHDLARASSETSLMERIRKLEETIQNQQRMIETLKLEVEQQKETESKARQKDREEIQELKASVEKQEKTPAETVAGPMPQGDSQVGLLDNYDVKIGLQYRVMFNASNIPLAGVSTTADTKSYDFFRQRMRFNIDVRPSDNVGGFLQLEYRGGWGGSSPANSDPRGVGLTLNAFNRLQSRGVRYGYIYHTPNANSYFAAGILPFSDQLGDTLFSADWDFNVGGIMYLSALGRLEYRLAYLRMIDGVASADRDVIGENSGLFIADASFPLGETTMLGTHIYYLDASDDIGDELGLPGEVSQRWYALSGSTKIRSTALNGFVCLNDGDYGDGDNTGWALKVEAAIPLGLLTLKLMAVYASGDEEGDRPKDQFTTVQGIFRTEGYWSYLHLFTANGPSDVNDLGVGLDNGGRGLTTFQAKIEAPLLDKLTGELAVGWFQASEDNVSGNKDMGTEISTVFSYALSERFHLHLGCAVAFLGDFYEMCGEGPDDAYEIFSRLQLQF